MLTVDDFRADLLILELRFEPALLLWDRAGLMWMKVLSFAPDLQQQSGAPNQQVFANRNMQITVEVGLMRLQLRGPQALKSLAHYGKELVATAVEFLKINDFTRVGYRSLLTKTYSTEAEAISATSEVAPKYSTKILGNQGVQVAFVLTRRIESDSAGVYATMKMEKREINIAAPWDAMPFMKDVKQKEYVVSLDADYYTIGETSGEALDVSLWAEQADKRIKRFWGEVLA